MTYLWKRPGLPSVMVGDADEAGAVCRNKVKGKTITKYSREGLPKSNPCPKPVTIDLETRRAQFILDEIREWDAKRPGPGDHGGPGYGYREDAATRAATREIGLATLDEIIAGIDAACPERHEWPGPGEASA